MTAREDGRAWVAECRFAGAAKPFWFGHVFVRLRAPQHEIEQAVMAALSDILPPGYPRPQIVSLQPGMLVFLPER